MVPIQESRYRGGGIYWESLGFPLWRGFRIVGETALSAPSQAGRLKYSDQLAGRAEKLATDCTDITDVRSSASSIFKGWN